MQVPEFTVVDFNAGFGGRSLAFRDCGFSVVTAAESDPVKQEILRGIVPNIPIFTEPISLENLSSLPGTDILMADIPAESPARLRVNQKKDDVDSYLHLFSEFILCNQPKAFLIQIPAVLVQGKSVSFLSAAARRRYVITYRVCRESEYSGFPVNGRQPILLEFAMILARSASVFRSQYMSLHIVYHFGKHRKMWNHGIAMFQDDLGRILLNACFPSITEILREKWSAANRYPFVLMSVILWTRSECGE